MLRKVVQSAKIEGKDWKQEMYRYLRNYRSTPHISTGKAPAEIIISSRTYRTKLPQIGLRYDDKDRRERDSLSKAKQKGYADDKDIRERDSLSKAKQKGYADDKDIRERDSLSKAKQKGYADTVLVKQRKLDKLTPPFSPDPLEIIRIKGYMITAKSVKTAVTITRNSSFFKKIPSRKNEGTSHDDQ